PGSIPGWPRRSWLTTRCGSWPALTAPRPSPVCRWMVWTAPAGTGPRSECTRTWWRRAGTPWWTRWRTRSSTSDAREAQHGDDRAVVAAGERVHAEVVHAGAFVHQHPVDGHRWDSAPPVRSPGRAQPGAYRIGRILVAGAEDPPKGYVVQGG